MSLWVFETYWPNFWTHWDSLFGVQKDSFLSLFTGFSQIITKKHENVCFCVFLVTNIYQFTLVVKEKKTRSGQILANTLLLLKFLVYFVTHRKQHMSFQHDFIGGKIYHTEPKLRSQSQSQGFLTARSRSQSRSEAVLKSRSQSQSPALEAGFGFLRMSAPFLTLNLAYNSHILYMTDCFYPLFFTVANLGHGRPGKIPHNYTELLPQCQWSDTRLRHYQRKYIL